MQFHVQNHITKKKVQNHIVKMRSSSILSHCWYRLKSHPNFKLAFVKSWNLVAHNLTKTIYNRV